jgi:iron complex transport system substrate-binding protein
MLGRALGVLFAIALLIGADAAASAHPTRIVSLAPAVTETLFALGEGGAVVGVSRIAIILRRRRTRPRSALSSRPTSSAIAALRPDLITSGPTPPRAGARSAH